jgi:hypothetical protein
MIRSLLFSIAALSFGACVTFDEARAQGQQFDQYGKPIYVEPYPSPPRYQGSVPGYINCPDGGRVRHYEMCAPYSTPSHGGYGYYGYTAQPQVRYYGGRPANQYYTPNYSGGYGYQPNRNQHLNSGRPANQGYTPNNYGTAPTNQQERNSFSSTGRPARQTYSPNDYSGGGRQSRPEYRENERVQTSNDGSRQVVIERRQPRNPEPRR